MNAASRDDAEPFVGDDGATVRELIRGAASSLAAASLPAGGAARPHHHRLAEEVYHVVEGGGEVEVAGETRQVRPGDTVVIPPGAWHTLRASDRGIEILCVCSPPWSADDTFFE